MGLKDPLGILGGDDPRAINLTGLIKTTQQQEDLAYQQMQDQLQWGQDIWGQTQNQLGQTLGMQNQLAQQQLGQAQQYGQDYLRYYRPLEVQLAQDAASFNTPQRQAFEAARAQAAQQQAFDAQRTAAQRNLESYGIDPSQTRAQALDMSARVANAAQMAAAGNAGRAYASQMARDLGNAAIGVGQFNTGLAQQSAGNAANLATSALGNMNAATTQGMNLLGTGMQWQTQGMNATNQQAGLATQYLNNQLAAQGAAGAGLAGLGNLAGQAFGGWASGGFKTPGAGAQVEQDTVVPGGYNGGYTGDMGAAYDGGAIPSDLSSTPHPKDTIPTMLAEGEYVIPADIVKYKGIEFFDKLKEKTKATLSQKGQVQQGQQPQQSPPPVQGLYFGGIVRDPNDPNVQAMNYQPQPYSTPQYQGLQVTSQPAQQQQQQGGQNQQQGVSPELAYKVYQQQIQPRMNQTSTPTQTATPAQTAAPAQTATPAATPASTASTAAAPASTASTPAASGGSGMGAVGPWALLAAAIIANETDAKKTGYRPDSKTDWFKDVMTLDNAEVDFTERYPRKQMDALGYSDAKQDKILSSPTGKAYTSGAKIAVDYGQGLTADAVTGTPGAGSAEYGEAAKSAGKWATNVTKMNDQVAPGARQAAKAELKKPIEGTEKAGKAALKTFMSASKKLKKILS